MLIPFDKASKERGFAPVANELLMKLASCSDITARQYRIIMLVIRKTYGYKEGNTTDEQLRKKYDWIAKNQLISGLEYKGDGGHLLADIRKLLDRKILRSELLPKYYNGQCQHERCVGINPYINQWCDKNGKRHAEFLSESAEQDDRKRSPPMTVNGRDLDRNQSISKPKTVELVTIEDRKRSPPVTENGRDLSRKRSPQEKR